MSSPESEKKDSKALGHPFVPAATLFPSLLFPIRGGTPTGSSKIHGIGLRARTGPSTLITHHKEEKELPPTPAELAALESKTKSTAIPIEDSGSWATVRLHNKPTEARVGCNECVGPEDHDDNGSDVTDLGWPPVEELFADLPEPVTPVFRTENSSLPPHTTWNRRNESYVSPKYQIERTNKPWLSLNHKTR